MGQACHLAHEVIEEALSFVGDLVVDDGDGFVWDGGDEAAGVPFDECHPHLVELVVPAIHINAPILVLPFDVVHCVLHEERPPTFVTVNADLYALRHLLVVGEGGVSVVADLLMDDCWLALLLRGLLGCVFVVVFSRIGGLAFVVLHV